MDIEEFVDFVNNKAEKSPYMGITNIQILIHPIIRNYQLSKMGLFDAQKTD